MESLLRRRNENTVPLSPMVLVGPSDALLNQPIKIFMPHCIPTQNAAWNLKVHVVDMYHGHLTVIGVSANILLLVTVQYTSVSALDLCHLQKNCLEQ